MGLLTQVDIPNSIDLDSEISLSAKIVDYIVTIGISSTTLIKNMKLILLTRSHLAVYRTLHQGHAFGEELQQVSLPLDMRQFSSFIYYCPDLGIISATEASNIITFPQATWLRRFDIYRINPKKSPGFLTNIFSINFSSQPISFNLVTIVVGIYSNPGPPP